MKLRVMCPVCTLELEDGVPIPPMIHAELADDGFVRTRCDSGHEGATVVQKERFQLLLDFGIMAFIDGYNREAVTTLASATERVQEFYLRAAAFEHGLAPSEFETGWKLLARQSERQHGAFVFMHMLETRSTFRVLEQRHVELRNNAVHKGYLPTSQEVHDFGNRVLEFIHDALEVVAERYAEGAKQSFFSTQSQIAARVAALKIPLVRHTSFMSFSGAVDWNPGAMVTQRRTFAEAVEVMRGYRGGVWNP